jgi:hypothetical protein
MDHIILYRPVDQDGDNRVQPVKVLHFKEVADAHAVMLAITSAYNVLVPGSKVGGIILEGDLVLETPVLIPIVEVDLKAIRQTRKEREAREDELAEAREQETAHQLQSTSDEAKHQAQLAGEKGARDPRYPAPRGERE